MKAKKTPKAVKKASKSGHPPTLVISTGKKEAIVVQKTKLVAVSGPVEGKEFVVDKDVFTMGSGPLNDLVLDDSTVSRRHCEIRLIPEGYMIRDLGSTNGTYVQGVRVTEAFVGRGTQFQLGMTRLVSRPQPGATEYALSPNNRFGAAVGQSLTMRHLFHTAETYAPTSATILIEGETGTGKEVVAEEIHRHSPRKNKPFVVIDCASLTRDLIESELFGHTKGAFTGATADRAGAFEAANGGTVFLDEIGDFSPDLQPKLLRVLERKEVRRVGSNKVRGVDVRVVCATNRQLENEVNAGRFREDLYYRISVVRLELPPLRRRKEDIPLLTERFLKEFMGNNAMDHVADFDAATRAFRNHDWPGNVRELRNLIEIASSGERPINLSSFLYFGAHSPQDEAPTVIPSADEPFKAAKSRLVGEFEKTYIRDLLEKHSGNVSSAAKEAGIERAYLQRLIKKHDISRTEFKETSG